MKKSFLFILSLALIFAVTQNLFAQRLFDQVLTDSAGFIYVTGQTKCNQDSDIVIIKYNPSDGGLIWQKKMGLPGNSFFRGSAIRGSSIYVVALNNLGGNKKVALIKSDLSGNTSTVFFDRPGGDYGNSITIDNSGNVIVAGRNDSPLNNPKFLILKFGPNLDSIWNYTYSGPLSGNFDEALSVKTDPSGNIIATGYTSAGLVLTDTYDYLTVKLNSAGVLQWAKRHNGTSNKEDRSVVLAVDTGGNSYASGYSYTGNGSVVFTIKYNAFGDSVASVTYGCGNNTLNQPTAISYDIAGNIFITGFGQCDAYNHSDYVTVKYNTSLTSQWGTPPVYSGSGNCVPSSIYYSGDAVYVTGESDSSNGNRRFATLKYDPATGSELWRWITRTSDSNYASSVITDVSGGVYISGYSVPDTITTMKYTSWVSKYGYCPPFGIRTISTLTPKQFTLQQNYPNPFNPSTLIKFDLAEKTNARIAIYDLLGREVDLVTDRIMQPGSYELEWDGSNFDSGVYLIQLKTDKYTETKKMVLLK